MESAANAAANATPNPNPAPNANTKPRSNSNPDHSNPPSPPIDVVEVELNRVVWSNDQNGSAATGTAATAAPIGNGPAAAPAPVANGHVDGPAPAAGKNSPKKPGAPAPAAGKDSPAGPAVSAAPTESLPPIAKLGPSTTTSRMPAPAVVSEPASLPPLVSTRMAAAATNASAASHIDNKLDAKHGVGTGAIATAADGQTSSLRAVGSDVGSPLSVIGRGLEPFEPSDTSLNLDSSLQHNAADAGYLRVLDEESYAIVHRSLLNVRQNLHDAAVAAGERANSSHQDSNNAKIQAVQEIAARIKARALAEEDAFFKKSEQQLAGWQRIFKFGVNVIVNAAFTGLLQQAVGYPGFAKQMALNYGGLVLPTIGITLASQVIQEVAFGHPLDTAVDKALELEGRRVALGNKAITNAHYAGYVVAGVGVLAMQQVPSILLTVLSAYLTEAVMLAWGTSLVAATPLIVGVVLSAVIGSAAYQLGQKLTEKGMEAITGLSSYSEVDRNDTDNLFLPQYLTQPFEYGVLALAMLNFMRALIPSTDILQVSNPYFGCYPVAVALLVVKAVQQIFFTKNPLHEGLYTTSEAGERLVKVLATGRKAKEKADAQDAVNEQPFSSPDGDSPRTVAEKREFIAQVGKQRLVKGFSAVGFAGLAVGAAAGFIALGLENRYAITQVATAIVIPEVMVVGALGVVVAEGVRAIGEYANAKRKAYVAAKAANAPAVPADIKGDLENPPLISPAAAAPAPKPSATAACLASAAAFFQNCKSRCARPAVKLPGGDQRLLPGSPAVEGRKLPTGSPTGDSPIADGRGKVPQRKMGGKRPQLQGVITGGPGVVPLVGTQAADAPASRQSSTNRK